MRLNVKHKHFQSVRLQIIRLFDHSILIRFRYESRTDFKIIDVMRQYQMKNQLTKRIKIIFPFASRCKQGT